jgi:hypothetical protein
MDRHQEAQMALKIRQLTGKKLRTCIFCIRYHHGNFQKALEMCSESPSEGGRQG